MFLTSGINIACGEFMIKLDANTLNHLKSDKFGDLYLGNRQDGFIRLTEFG